MKIPGGWGRVKVVGIPGGKPKIEKNVDCQGGHGKFVRKSVWSTSKKSISSTGRGRGTIFFWKSPIRGLPVDHNECCPVTENKMADAQICCFCFLNVNWLRCQSYEIKDQRFSLFYCLGGLCCVGHC